MNAAPDPNWEPDSQLLAAYFDGELEGRDDLAETPCACGRLAGSKSEALEQCAELRTLQQLWLDTTPAEPTAVAWQQCGRILMRPHSASSACAAGTSAVVRARCDRCRDGAVCRHSVRCLAVQSKPNRRLWCSRRRMKQWKCSRSPKRTKITILRVRRRRHEFARRRRSASGRIAGAGRIGGGGRSENVPPMVATRCCRTCAIEAGP